MDAPVAEVWLDGARERAEPAKLRTQYLPPRRTSEHGSSPWHAIQQVLSHLHGARRELVTTWRDQARDTWREASDWLVVIRTVTMCAL